MKHVEIPALVAVLLAGCASNSAPPLTTEQRLSLYQQNSTPVGGFRVDNRAGRVQHWSPLGDQALTIQGFGAQPYLLELRNRCSGLSFATSISISNSFGNVQPGFDSVTPLAAGGRPASVAPGCRIQSARRINQGAVNQAKRDLRDADREASLVERDPNARPDDGAQ
jgi:hypothetical protein